MVDTATDIADTSTTDTTTTTAFDYNELAKIDQEWLRRAAAQLRISLRRTVREIIASGKVLICARRRLGRGLWAPWLSTQAQVPRRSASRLIGVNRVFGELNNDILEHFTPTALYTLAELGVPQSIREYAVAQAREGKDVSAGKVEEWLKLQRDTKLGSTKEASKDEPIEKTYDAAKVNAADNWLMLVALLSDDNTLHLSHSSDTENEDLLVSGVLITPEGRKAASGITLEAVVLSLSGQRREKRCKGACGLVKPLDEFSKRQDRPDGRNAYCLKCERDRVKRYEAAKRAEARLATASGAT